MRNAIEGPELWFVDFNEILDKHIKPIIMLFFAVVLHIYFYFV